MSIPIIGDIITGVTGIINKAIPDADKREEINLKLAELADQAQARLDAQMTAQTDINKIEAGNPNIFVAGWRPFIGWVGGIGLAYSAVFEPFMEFVSKTVFKYSGVFPALNTEVLLQVLLALLGMGIMRSFDKAKGTETTGTNLTPAGTAPSPAPVPTAGSPPKKHFHIF